MSKPVTLLLSAVLSLCSILNLAQAEDAMPDPDLRSAARDSYIFTSPLVMMYRTMYLQAIDAASPSYAGGMGAWPHLGVATP